MSVRYERKRDSLLSFLSYSFVSHTLFSELKVGAKFVFRAIDGDFTPFERADPRSPIPIVRRNYDDER